MTVVNKLLTNLKILTCNKSRKMEEVQTIQWSKEKKGQTVIYDMFHLS